MTAIQAHLSPAPEMEYTPEQRLWSAVLGAALVDACSGHLDAIDWINERGGEWLGSFEWVCREALGLDPGKARAAFREVVREHHHSPRMDGEHVFAWCRERLVKRRLEAGRQVECISEELGARLLEVVDIAETIEVPAERRDVKIQSEWLREEIRKYERRSGIQHYRIWGRVLTQRTPPVTVGN